MEAEFVVFGHSIRIIRIEYIPVIIADFVLKSRYGKYRTKDNLVRQIF